MRLRFLGTGTSSGVPAIGCRCDVCASIDPRDTRTRTSATLEFTDPAGVRRVVLIDASPDLRQQALREHLDRLDAILITHDHADHVLGLDEVRRFNVLMRSSIPLYADERTHASLRRVFPYILDRTGEPESFVADLTPVEVRPLEPFDLFGVRVTPVPLLHGRAPILGYRFDAPAETGKDAFTPLAYCTDVSAFPDDARPALGGVRTLVLDALRHRPHPTHLTVAQALEAAAWIGADRTYLVHMTHDLAHAATQRELAGRAGGGGGGGRVVLAHDGLIVD